MTTDDVRELALWRDPEVLWELYVERGWSMTEIGKELGCSRQNVGRWLRQNLVTTRDEYDDAPWRDFDTLWELRIERRMSVPAIAEMFECHESTVSKYLRDNYIEPTYISNPGPPINDRLSEDPDALPPCPYCEKNRTGLLTSFRNRHGRCHLGQHYICEACEVGWLEDENGDPRIVDPTHPAHIRYRAGVVSGD